MRKSIELLAIFSGLLLCVALASQPTKNREALIRDSIIEAKKAIHDCKDFIRYGCKDVAHIGTFSGRDIYVTNFDLEPMPWTINSLDKPYGSTDKWHGANNQKKFDERKRDGLPTSAITACPQIGRGWYLPSIEELAFLEKNFERTGSLDRSHYWSSTEDRNGRALYIAANPGKRAIYPKKNHSIWIRCFFSS